MSWMKRAPGGAGPGASTGAAPQPYAAPQAQPFVNQQNSYPSYPVSSGSGQQQVYWAQQQQQAPAQYNQQYAQVYQQDHPSNTNQLYQQPAQYNHNYDQTYAHPPQTYQHQTPQNYYQNQTPQQNYSQNSGTNDGWEDNWDWGWEDSGKQARRAQSSAPSQPPHQQHSFNNANVIEESFAPTDSWNWAADDNNKGGREAPVAPSEQELDGVPLVVPSDSIQNNIPLEPNIQNSVNSAPPPTEEVRTLSDRDIVQEKLPNLALGKRFHLDNLTPQWSIESQMSQESSDGPQTHSESTYRSENHSRNSNSPGPITDNYNSYTQSITNDGYTQNSVSSRQSDEPTLADSLNTGSGGESQDQLSHSLQDLSLTNHENLSANNIQLNEMVEPNIAQTRNAAPPVPPLAPLPAPAASPLPPPPAQSLPPAPPVQAPPPAQALPPPPPGRPPSATLPRAPSPHSSSHSGGPPPAGVSSLPPPIFPPPSTNTQNPFKHAGPFGHKAKPASASAQPFPAPSSSAALTSPAVVGQVQHARTPVGFEANLETTPDNSERLDRPPPAAFRPSPPAPRHVPDNMEVAPQDDRNEYMQTAHLSSGDYGENTDFTRGAPPPGLRRMVVGRHETAYGAGAGGPGDEPPPGLARMVPGRQTEGDGGYDRPADDYMERLVDGRPPDGGGRAYRRPEGQRSPDAYAQTSRGPERRPLGLDRMVPGEPSDDDYPQYRPPEDDRRVVTGLERDFRGRDPAPHDAREHNLDGSAAVAPRGHTPEGGPGAEPPQERRGDTMEGENLQDLGAAEAAEGAAAPQAGERRSSLQRARSSAEDSERDREYAVSPRRDRRRASHERDRDEEGRYSRGERPPARDERRPDKERRRDRDRERRDRDPSPDARRQRRSAGGRRYDTEDTDYYSDKERDRRRHREGSYASKPPRGDDRERRYGTVERTRDRHDRDRRDRDRDRDRDRHERRYRDIDPSKKYGNLRREQDEDRRRVTFSSDAKANDSSRSEEDAYSSPSRADSREAPHTDEDATDSRRRDRRYRHRRTHDRYYDGYEASLYAEPYLSQRQQYEYYNRLRVSDPAAYMQLYRRIMAARALDQRKGPDLVDLSARGYGAVYESRGDERGSVHSGRSSAGLKGTDTYCRSRREGSLRDSLSLRTDLSDREGVTDGSLNLQLEESTVRSERMTPHRFSTAHVKGSIGSRDVVVVQGAYPVDGRPATVQVLSLRAALPSVPAAPTPLLKGVSHKKSVIEYCMVRVRSAAVEGARDVVGYALLWDLLALLLRQNGVVVGSDIAELLMNSIKDYEHNDNKSPRDDSRRTSSVSGSPLEQSRVSPAPPSPAPGAASHTKDHSEGSDAEAALNKLRELLIYGNRQEALEWATSNGLWGHAWALAAAGGRRARAHVSTRWLAALPATDPLHTLYVTLAPQLYTSVSEAQWGEWRSHAAIILSNAADNSEHHLAPLLQLGDRLAARGLLYSAQFVYLSCGVPFAAHPLAPLGAAPAAASAPPRLALLLADPRATSLRHFATDRAIIATEIYEYAMSLNRDYVINELLVYKFVMATRLCDGGQYERALAYVEAAARGAALAPHAAPPRLLRLLADLADRLKYHDPALVEGAGADEGVDSDSSPRHTQQWLIDVKAAADSLQQTESVTPQHHADYNNYQQQHNDYNNYQQQQQTWEQQAAQYQQEPPPMDAAPPPPVEEPPAYYAPPAAPPAAPEDGHYGYDWQRTEETHAQTYADPNSYWGGDSYNYNDNQGGAVEEETRPTITMPGTAPSTKPAYNDYDDEPTVGAEGTRQRAGGAETEGKRAEADKDKAEGSRGKGWLGGFLGKLSLRAPNQMILPDDKNPTIVWDADAKRWKNLDGEETSGAAPPPPPAGPPPAQLQHQPPSASPPLQTAAGTVAGPAPPVANIFKMQKGRHIKKSYVDVFNPSGAPSRAPPAPAPAPAPELLPAPPSLAPAPVYFVPQPQGEYDAASVDRYRSGI